MGDQDLAAFVRRWWDQVWGEGNLDLIDEMVADVYVRHSTTGTRIIRRDELKKDMAQYQRVVHRPVTTIDDQVVHGSNVWTRATSRGVNLETSEPSVVTWLIIQRIEDGRLVESWSAPIPNVDWTV